VTVSIVAEAMQTVTASAASAAEIPLTESVEKAEEGWSTYTGVLTAPAQAGSYPVTVTIRDHAGNAARATKTLTVAVAGLPRVAGVQALSAGDSVLLQWLSVAGATSYRIYFGASPADLSSHLETGSSAPSVRITGLPSGQSTSFAVTALAADGSESTQKSEVVSAGIAGSLFVTRALLLVNGAALEWNAPSADVVAYRIRYGVQPGTYTEERLADPRTTRFETRDLINGVPYYMLLTALLGDGKLLSDTELSVIPGEGGKPGMHLASPDPLPAAFRSSPPESPTIFHSSAPRPPRTPQSGLPFIAVTGVLLAAAVCCLRWRQARRRQEQRVILTIRRHYDAHR